MQPLNQARANIEATYRTMVTVWVVMLMSSGFLFLVTVVLVRLADSSTAQAPAFLIYAIAGTGLLMFFESFVFSRRFQQKAPREKSLKAALVGLVVPLALCEVSTLAGMIAVLGTRSRYFYLCFGLGALGIIMHFPKKVAVPFEY